MTPLTRAGVLELIASFEAIFDEAERDDPTNDLEAFGPHPQGFGVDIASGVEPANPDFAARLGRRFICAVDDGTCAAWGPLKRLPHGFSSREVMFYPPEEQR